MATIILGGWAGANWLPLLIPILVVFIVIVSFEYLFKFFRRISHRPSHTNTDISQGFDSVEQHTGFKE